MTPLHWLVLGLALVVAISTLLFRPAWRQRRRARLAAAPLTPERLATLQRSVPLYHRMPADLRRQLEGCVNVFLDEKRFYGCDGLTVSDEMRVTVAGNACVLLLNRGTSYFPGFSSILVYPETYVAPTETRAGAVVTTGLQARRGESWKRGPVVLSWRDVLHGMDAPGDGDNVVLHEFAHKLDEENGPLDGLPVLRDSDDYGPWAQVLSHEFERQSRRVKRHKHNLLDDYAVTKPAEFFAVATEAFFERGAQMRRRLPELYEQLRHFYGVDPASWHPAD